MTELSDNLTGNGNSLSHKEVARYSRHLIMPEVGVEGQLKLKKAKVLIVGTGGLGSPIALYLAAAGVGTIGLVDFDVVDASNLQRQIIHSEEWIGKPKLESAKSRIKSLNPFVEVILHPVPLHSENALEIMQNYDIVADSTDNFPTRYLVNDACVLLGIPNVYGSIFRFEGQASIFYAKEGPCYRCLYAEPPPPGLVPSCAEGGVLGVLPGIIGSIQANEVLKLIIGKGEPLINRLLLFDALDMDFRNLKLRKNPECLICGENPSIDQLIDYEEFCGVPSTGPAKAPQLLEDDIITINEYLKMREKNVEHKLIDVRDPHEQQISKIEGSILVPKDEIEKLADVANKDELLILHCKTGIRSAKALLSLKEDGYLNVKNLSGGINAWANLVDKSLPVY